MRVLVTGHNGYIGSVMVPVLSAAGHTLAGLDTFFVEDCYLTPDRASVPTLRIDIREVRVADLVGFDAVVHLASVPDGPAHVPWARSADAINSRGAVHLAEQAREAGVSRFLYASSCSVYGSGAGEQFLTEAAPLRPVSPAATARARAEEGIVRLADPGFSPVIMRNATAYGVSPRLRADILLNNLVAWAHTTGRVRVTSDGTPWRPLVHVEDIAHAFAAALGAPREILHGQTFNVGATSENYQVSELAEIVLGAVPGATIEYVPGPSHADSRSCRVDFGKLNRTLPAFRPRWNAAFGAKDLYAALQEADVTHETLQTRYSRSARLQQLVESGRLDAQLRWRDAALAGARPGTQASAIDQER
jgi:nucleoside-diphosphate-sugar epimerase